MENKQRLFQMMNKLNPSSKQQINENFQSELNEGAINTPIGNYVMFCFNYPPDFINNVWGENQNLANHLKSKFDSYYQDYGSRAVMNVFYANLDGGNQQKLENWISENYHG